MGIVGVSEIITKTTSVSVHVDIGVAQYSSMLTDLSLEIGWGDTFLVFLWGKPGFS